MERNRLRPAADAPDIPIACDLGVFTRLEQTEHIALCTDAVVRWPSERVELDDGFLFRYLGDEERFLTLARWAAAEHRCCSWASYSVEMGPFRAGERGQIDVRVRATAEGKEFLAAAHRYLTELDGAAPPEALLASTEKLTLATLIKRIKAGCGC
jgi:hypothetical protein